LSRTLGYVETDAAIDAERGTPGRLLGGNPIT
jgi:hypothetical protein